MFDPPLIKSSFICTYARKSEEDKYKQVQSIPDQLKINHQMAGIHEMTIPEENVFTEEMSASDPGRPVFNQLFDTIEQQTHTFLFCWKFDRLSRNPIDEGRIKWLLQKGKLTVITPYQIFNQDTNVIVTSVEGAQGTQYVIDLSRNVKRGLKSKREKGVPSGVAPPGYVNVGPTKGNRWWEPDSGNPDRFRLVQDAFKLILNGTEPMEAWRILNEEWHFTTIKRRRLGGGPLSKSTWYAMLKDPTYFGKDIAYDGKPNEVWFEIKHPQFKPMITEADYWRIQSILGEVGRQRPRLHGQDRGVYLRLISCGQCGNVMSHDRKKHVRCVCKTKYSALNRNTCPTCGLHESRIVDKRKHLYDFWFCPTKGCTQSIYHTDDIETETAANLDNIMIPPEFIQWGMDYLETQNDEEIKSQEVQLQAINHLDEENEKELRRLNKLYVSGGYEYEGGEAAYKKQQDELLEKRVKIRKEKAQFTKYTDNWRDQTEEGYRYCRDAADSFRTPDAHHRTKREIFSSLCDKATIKGDKLILDIDLPFVFIKKKLDLIKEKFGFTEPAEIAKFLSESTDSDTIEAIKLTWLPN